VKGWTPPLPAGAAAFARFERKAWSLTNPAVDPYERLADHFEAALDMAHLDCMVGL